MKVVATFHPPSSVVGSVSCHLTEERDVHHLAIATTNRLEVFSATETGLKPECSTEIWGRIVSLKVWHAPNGRGADSLVVLTDHPDSRLIRFTYDPIQPSLERAHVVSLGERGGVREAEFLQDVIVSTDGKTAVASVYTGKLRVITLDVEKNKMTDFDVTCQEYSILSLEFISSKKNRHVLAILFFDFSEKIRLRTRELHTEKLELSPNPSLDLRECIPNIGLSTLTDPPPFLIHVPYLDFDDGADEFLGGVLLVGGSKIRLFERTDSKYKQNHKSDHKKAANADKADKASADKPGKPRASIVWPWAEVTAWCAAHEDGTRYIICDAFGRVALLSLDNLPTDGLLLLPLGEVSPAATISYITNQVLFLGSHYGDSQLIRIRKEAVLSSTAQPPPLYGLSTVKPSSVGQSSSNAKGKGKTAESTGSKSKGKIIKTEGVYLEVIDTRANIAPIMDAVLADTDGSGLPQIFTASGGKNTGSVRVVRNGADFVDVAHITGAGNFSQMFPLRQTCDDMHDAYILATDGLTTQLLDLKTATSRIDRVDPAEFGFISEAPTLAAGNVRSVEETRNKGEYANSSWIVQVTPKSVIVVDLTTRSLRETWKPPPSLEGKEIMLADVNQSMIIVALEGGWVVSILLDKHGKPFYSRGANFVSEWSTKTRRRKWHTFSDIAALSCAPEKPNRHYTLRVVIGFWNRSVEIVKFSKSDDSFDPVEPPLRLSDLSAIPRSVLLHTFASGETYLFAGLADGTVVACAVGDKALLDRRVFAMGAAPVGLAMCSVNGQTAVFASGSRAAVLSLQSGLLHHSPVLAKNVTASVLLSVEGWESSILLSTRDQLMVGKVRAVNKMQIRTIPFGLDNPVRLAHEPISKTLGVGCVHADPSPLRDMDAAKSGLVSSFKLLDDTTHEVLSTYSCQPFEEITSVTTFTPSGSDARTYYAIGTMFTDSVVHDEPSKGRIVLLLPGKGYATTDTLTAEAAAQVQGCVYALLCVDGFIVAAMNSAVMVFKLTSGSEPALDLVYSWNHDYIVASLAAHGNRIFDGDAVHSVSALDLRTSEAGQTSLQTVARNYGPLWPNALGAWSKDTVVGSNADLNLFSFSLQRSGLQTVLERDGYFNVDDVINKFVPGSVHSKEDAIKSNMSARQLFFTASGRIAAILDMSQDLSLQMSSLQRNLAAALSTGKDTSHARWRAPVGSRTARSDADDGAVGFLDGDLLERFLNLAPGSETFEKVMEGNSTAERLEMTYEQIRAVLETMQGMH